MSNISSSKPAFGAQKRFYISTAISYSNGSPHIGHAYELIATDALARFKRLDGFDVLFLTGSDEHGQKVFKTARDEGITPQELASKYTNQFIELTHAMNASNDDFIKTTEPRHHKASQEIWKRMAANGDIYKDSYAGWYSVRDEAYYEESETKLNEEKQRIGPQGSPVEWVEEESYFFKLSAYGDKLLALYENDPGFLLPDSRRNEIASFVKSGLRDLSVSRTTFDWGVKVPGDDAHVMYVWVDALTNYLTGTGWPEKGERSAFWPADIHIIGKDITRFHAVYWPAFLMSAGIELPKRVFSHGFLLSRGEKMSKSIGNVVDPFELAAKFGIDQLRYFLLRETPFGQDGNFSNEAITNRINADLANDLGNLAQRSLSMIAKNCEGRVPEAGEFDEQDNSILEAAYSLLVTTRTFMDEQQIHKAIDAIWKVVADCNKYFAGQEPWALKKSDPQRMATVLYVTAEVIRVVSILAQPVMPESCNKLLDLLAIGDAQRDFVNLGADDALTSGADLPKPEGIFPRFVESGDE